MRGLWCGDLFGLPIVVLRAVILRNLRRRTRDKFLSEEAGSKRAAIVFNCLSLSPAFRGDSRRDLPSRSFVHFAAPKPWSNQLSVSVHFHSGLMPGWPRLGLLG